MKKLQVWTLEPIIEELDDTVVIYVTSTDKVRYVKRYILLDVDGDEIVDANGDVLIVKN